jgi:hypothetical protein
MQAANGCEEDYPLTAQGKAMAYFFFVFVSALSYLLLT